MNKVMKELKKPKVLIALMLLMIYVLSKGETREGHRGKNKSNHEDLHKNLVTNDAMKKRADQHNIKYHSKDPSKELNSSPLDFYRGK